MPGPRTFEVGINSLWPGEKLPRGDPRWSKHTASFQTESHSLETFAQRVTGDGCAFSAVCRDAYRDEAHFISAQHLALDDDRGTAESSLEALAAEPFIAANAAILYETPSSKPDNPKARVVFVLDEPFTDPGAWRQAQAALLWKYGDTDPQVKDAARFFYGRRDAPRRLLGHVLYRDILQQEVIEPYVRHQGTNGHKPAAAVDAAIPLHQRNHTLTSLAGTMRRRSMSQEAIEAALLVENKAKCQPPLDEDEVRSIARSVGRYPPGATPGLGYQAGGSFNEPNEAAPLRVRRMADVAPELVSWLWWPYIPKGKLTLLEGDPGVGKSWVALAIATAVSLGKGLPGEEAGEPANVLLASAEDGLGDTIRPRLDAMGADVARIHAVDGPLTLDDMGFPSLESAIAAVRPALVVLDPLVAYLGDALDIHRANETRHVMAALARLAETHGLALVAVRHLTKGGASKPIYRGLGSIDFTAACRSVLLAGHAAENPQEGGIVQIKSNLAPAGAAIGYELRDGGFYWTGESALTAGDILAADDGSGSSQLEEATAFLQEELADGPVLAAQVLRNADGAGLKARTVNRAKPKLGVVTHRQGEPGKRGGGRFTWHLPDHLDCQDCHIEKSGNVNDSKAKNRASPAKVGNQNGVEV